MSIRINGIMPVMLTPFTEQNEIGVQHGRSAVAVLLFQDLAVIPFLILIPALAGGLGGGAIAGDMLWAFGKGTLAVVVKICWQAALARSKLNPRSSSATWMTPPELTT